MAKVYARKYQRMIDDGEITLDEAIAKVLTEVPERWQEQVIALLHEKEITGEPFD